MPDSFDPARLTRRAALGGAGASLAIAQSESAQNAVGDTNISVRAWAGSDDDAAMLQRAFDQAPIGSVLHLPAGDYVIRRPLRMVRKIHIEAHGARLIGQFGPRGDDLITVNVADEANRDNRNQLIRGLTALFESGGRHLLRVTNQAPNTGNLGMLIEHCNLAVRDDRGGCSVSLEGLGTHHNQIRNCQLANGIDLTCADGTRIYDNVLLGARGVRVALVPGAFRTSIHSNAISCRDYGIWADAGDQVDVIGNQFEQGQTEGRSRSSVKSHLVLNGRAARPLHGWRVIGNNFGGGPLQDVPVSILGHAYDILIDENVFNPGLTERDIDLRDASIKWVRIGPSNLARGNRPRADPGNPLVVLDQATGTYGVWKPLQATTASAASGWRPRPGARFKKLLDDTLIFDGAIDVGISRAGASTGIALPIGFRPRGTCYLKCVDRDTGGFASLGVDGPSGLISAAAAAGVKTVDLTGALLPIQGRDSYINWP